LEHLHWDEQKELLPNVEQPSTDDRRTVLQIRNEDWAEAKRWHSQVIGTIEAGFYDPKRGISRCKALRTAVVAAERAWDLYRASLENVFWTISQAAINIVGANAASLYFARDQTQTDPELVHYIYQACEGVRFPRSPAFDRLGQRALQTRKSLFIPDKQLEQDEQYLREFDRAAYDAGLRAVAAIPIVYNEDDDELFAHENADALRLTKEGLLYVGFAKPHWFTEDEINRLELLANRANDAIRDATNYTKTRDRARRLANVYKIVQSLADDHRSTSILDEIAGAVLNILGADIVSIYEYDEREKRLLLDRSTIAGRLIEPGLVNSPVIDELSGPTQLLKTRENIYAEDATSHRILAAKRGSDGFEKSFVARECVRSAAAVMLRTPKELLGLMFVNYRSLHRFTAEDRQVIETAGSIIAIPILDRRMRANEESLERIESRLRKVSNQEAEPETILQNVFAVLREIVDFDIATYVEYQAGADENARTLVRARFAVDGLEPFTWPARWVEIDPPLIKWMKGDDRLIPDLNEFYNTKAGAKELRRNPVALQYKKRGAHSVVNVPRIDGDRLLGAFSLARRKNKPPFRMDEQDRLDRLGLDRIMRLVSEKFQTRHQQLAASVTGLFEFDDETSAMEIAQKFVDLIGPGFGWEYVAIFRVARVRKQLEVVAQYDGTRGKKLSVKDNYSQPLEGEKSGMIGKTRREGVTLRARDVRPPRRRREGWEAPHNYIRTNPAQASAMCVPVN
jgi:GAF domain-containing protein